MCELRTILPFHHTSYIYNLSVNIVYQFLNMFLEMSLKTYDIFFYLLQQR